MKVFELEATFDAEPPQEPEPLRVYRMAGSPHEAISRLKLDGATDVRMVREFSDQETRQFRYLRSAELWRARL
jgi:hypothetical protein